MPNRIIPLILLAALLPSLGGCAETLFLGAVTGMSVAQDRRSTGAVVDDIGIELNAGGELRAIPGLDEQTHINITSYNGIVLLSGEAPTAELRDLTARITRFLLSLDAKMIVAACNTATVHAIGHLRHTGLEDHLPHQHRRHQLPQHDEHGHQQQVAPEQAARPEPPAAGGCEGHHGWRPPPGAVPSGTNT